MRNLKKKSFPAPHSDRADRFKRFLLIVLALLSCVAVLALFWLLSRLGPQRVDYDNLDYSVEVAPEVPALLQQSIEVEAQFDEIMVLRPPNVEDLKVLKRALELQVEYVEALPLFDDEAIRRRKDLDQRYQDLQGARLRVASDAFEVEAQKLLSGRDYEAARDQYQQAYAQQKLINENFPLSESYDVGRATRLQRQARYLTAEPIMKRSLELESKADACIAKQDWAQAEALLQQSIELQDRLNREYRGSNQASVSRFERLKVKQVGIQSGQYQLEIEEVSDLADTRLAEGETLAAADLYQQGARLQRQLNEAYPDSPYASSERVLEFKRKSQTAQSFELGVEIERNHDLLKRLLSERRTYEAAEVIVALRRDIKQMEAAYPRSSLNDDELQHKVRYLNLAQNDLRFIQDRVYDALLSVPGVEDFRMLRTEVPQALYSLIMGRNPSRNQGELAPVDSVNWVEAKAFCERLSWIMGKTVRLPTEHEFRQALGRLRYVVLEKHVWSVTDADGVAQPIATKAAFASGFHDLLGNVSEWLESIDRFESEDARHIGGHAQDRLEVIFTVPVRSAPRGERSRLAGFRVVVAVD